MEAIKAVVKPMLPLQPELLPALRAKGMVRRFAANPLFQLSRMKKRVDFKS